MLKTVAVDKCCCSEFFLPTIPTSLNNSHCVMTWLVICFQVCTNLHQDCCTVLYIVGELGVCVWDFACVC